MEVPSTMSSDASAAPALGGDAERTARRAAEYRRMKMTATGLLVLMFVLFIAARLGEATWPWLSFPRAFAEAAMVGAFADWFAVTALFRHPFGLPIPHTAIIPRNKDRIGESLGRFIASNFLAPEVVAQKLQSMDLAGRIAAWLSQPANSAFLAAKTTDAIPPVMQALDDEHVRIFVRDAVTRRLRAVDASSLASRVLGVLVAHRHHQALFDQVLDIAHTFLFTNRDVIRAKVRAKSSKWIPQWVDDKLAEKIISGAEDTLLELRNPDHVWREEFNVTTERFIAKLAESPEYKARGEQIKEEILKNPKVQDYLGSVWNEVRSQILADAESDQGAIERGLDRALLSIGTRLRDDPGMQAILNGWIERVVIHYAVPHRDQIGTFISGVVARWDTRTVVEKLELQVGKDLQYIRINGTLVGGLVGLLIHLVSVFMM